MFSDLVGSTALSARMDPEDLREVISAYQKCVAETVGRFGGFVAKYMGDGVLVYFGYPQAHEDDAERAVRAGLELVAAVSGLNTHAPLKNRVGIATGLVVVGDLIGSGAALEQAIVGETPNLAARLQSVAEPNNVVIAESARELVGDLFELEDLGAQDLKGIAGSVRTWAALRPSSVESRFDALHAGGLTELIGREEERLLLLLFGGIKFTFFGRGSSRQPDPGPQLFCRADGSNAPTIISTLSEKFTALNIPAVGISISLSKTSIRRGARRAQRGTALVLAAQTTGVP
jgi:class 3 adenylate cyclase